VHGRCGEFGSVAYHWKETSCDGFGFCEGACPLGLKDSNTALDRLAEVIHDVGVIHVHRDVSSKAANCLISWKGLDGGSRAIRGKCSKGCGLVVLGFALTIDDEAEETSFGGVDKDV
jgi:Fe-S-cluster-containing dehydrogenase component